MNHSMPTAFDPMDLIVALVFLLALAFTIAWAASPKFRAWIEKPSYRFRENARTYDESLK